MKSKPNQIEVIYLGGTFASAGSPLSPVSSVALIRLLTQALDQFQKSTLGQNLASVALNISTPITISDSSQLDSQAFIKVVQALARIRHKPCLVITGTDTLSFLSSYIAISGAHPNCCILASMDTLINLSTGHLNSQSYAFNSFTAALASLLKDSGVRCVVDGHQLHPLRLNKLHSHSPEAFRDHFTPNTISSHQSTSLGSTSRLTPPDISTNFANFVAPQIAVCFATPSHPQLIHQLTQLALSSPDALLLVGYGAGNFVKTQEIQALLETITQNSLILVSTQVNFGGCSWNYAAGSWLSELAISSSSLNYSASYAALLHVCCSQISLSNRRASLIDLIGILDTE